MHSPCIVFEKNHFWNSRADHQITALSRKKSQYSPDDGRCGGKRTISNIFSRMNMLWNEAIRQSIGEFCSDYSESQSIAAPLCACLRKNSLLVNEVP
jgi:hypothetical protein